MLIVRILGGMTFVGLAFLVFGSGVLVKEHLSSIQALDDQTQLRADIGVQALFEELADRRLIRLDPETMAMTLPREDEVIARQVEGRGPGTDDPTTDADQLDHRLIRYLYYSKNGLVLRRQIERWNKQFRFAAIREAGPTVGVRKEIAELPTPLVYKPGDIPNSWTPRAVADNGQDGLVYQRSIPNPHIDHHRFRVFANIDGAFASDWLRGAPVYQSSTHIAFLRDITDFPRRGTVRLDVLGVNPVVYVDDVRHDRGVTQTELNGSADEPTTATRVTLDLSGIPANASRMEVRAEPIQIIPHTVANIQLGDDILLHSGGMCDKTDRNTRDVFEHCDLLKEKDYCDSLASRSREPVSSVTSGTSVSSSIGRENDTGERDCEKLASRFKTISNQEHLVLTCSVERPLCRVTWRDLEKPIDVVPVAEEEPIPEIRTADGIVLNETRRSASAVERAWELGLAPLVGFSKSDPFGLTFHIQDGEKTCLDQNALTLTINSRLQDLAMEGLEAVLGPSSPQEWDSTIRDKHGGVGDRGGWYGGIVLMHAGGEDDFRGFRSGRAGEVLAAASWPPVPRHVSQWDLLAHDSRDRTESKVSPRAWSRTDSKYFSPGSTFKPITAMAFIREIARRGGYDSPLFQPLQGVGARSDAFGFPLPTGVSFKDDPDGENGLEGRGLKVPKAPGIEHLIENFRSKATSGYVQSWAESACATPAGFPETHKKLGLCEAITESANSWFAAAMLSVDLDAINALNFPNTRNVPDPSDLALIQMLERLGMTREHRPLFPDCGFDRAVSRERLYVAPTVVGVTQSRLEVHPAMVLGLNAIGQDIQVAPTSMAAAYASIATQCVVDPTFIPKTDDEASRCRQVFFDADGAASNDNGVARTLVDKYLFPGMKNVVNNKDHGTAGEVFASKDYRSSIFAKTGTAEISDSDGGKIESHTVHFAGWVESGAFPGIDHRIAFVCTLTHASSSAFGGSVCGPLMATIFDRLHDNHMLKATGQE